MTHGHLRVPANPSDGDVFTCDCGVAFRYVVMENGYAEWVSATP